MNTNRAINLYYHEPNYSPAAIGMLDISICDAGQNDTLVLTSAVIAAREVYYLASWADVPENTVGQYHAYLEAIGWHISAAIILPSSQDNAITAEYLLSLINEGIASTGRVPVQLNQSSYNPGDECKAWATQVLECHEAIARVLPCLDSDASDVRFHVCILALLAAPAGSWHCVTDNILPVFVSAFR